MKSRCAAFSACLSLLFASACEGRRFATERTAVEHLRAHHDAYVDLAKVWLASGNRHLYWFGWRHGRENYSWNEFWVSPSDQGWEVRHWNGHQYITQSAKSFDETAAICDSSGTQVASWHHRLELLGVDTITRVSAVRDGTSFNYVEIGYFPESDTYGFLYAPDHTAKEQLLLVSEELRQAKYRVDAINGEWFYYEGRWRIDSVPFSRVQ